MHTPDDGYFMQPKHVAAIGFAIKKLCVDELRPYALCAKLFKRKL